MDKKLNNKEETVMKILWRLKKAFVKDIIDEMPAPKPPYNTVSSLVRKMETDGLLGYKAYGKSHQYFPILKKEDYRKWSFKDMMQDYFGGSKEALLSFFVQEEKINETELQDLLEKIKNKSND